MTRIALLSLLALLTACSIRKWPLVIVLGIDGMDPKFVDQHLADLPNLRRLMKQGEYKRLATTMPPQSPVAWSTFSTGLDPDEHGLFDFVYRDPDTGKPFSAMGVMDSSGHMKSFRHGTVFWKRLVDAGVPTKILRMPVNYPPEKTKAVALSGMGVTDMRGTFGTFTFFTDSPAEAQREVAGGDIEKVELKKDRALLNVTGPVGLKVTLQVDVDPFEDVARFKVGSETFILKAGEWSEWVPVSFERVKGMVRVYAKGFRPEFAVYVTPVNFDPMHPETTISAPASESARMATRMGLFYTQGMAEDTAAYRHGVFDRQEYLTQARMVADEQIRMMKDGLTDFNQGFFFLHFSGVDQNSHMLWGKFDDELLATYKLVDESVGWVMAKHPGATLIVMSDHGFNAFNRAVNLNAWDEVNKQAYALGLNAMYLKPGASRSGVETKLMALRDPLNGQQVIARVMTPKHSSRYIPDLIIGYEPGYRSSWEGSLGDGKGPVIADNNDAWIGDHCIAPEFVPGVLISNRKSGLEQPRLKDMAGYIWSLFGMGR